MYENIIIAIRWNDKRPADLFGAMTTAEIESLKGHIEGIQHELFSTCDYALLMQDFRQIETLLGFNTTMTETVMKQFFTKLHSVSGRVVRKTTAQVKTAEKHLRILKEMQGFGHEIPAEVMAKAEADVAEAKAMGMAVDRHVEPVSLSTFIDRYLLCYAELAVSEWHSMEEIDRMNAERRAAKRMAKKSK